MDLRDVSRHIPWVVHGAKEWLDSYLEADMKVLEWGSGGSTIYFCNAVREVVSIEHDPAWFGEVALALDMLALDNCRHLLVEPRRLPLARFAPYRASLYNSRTFPEYGPFCFRNYVRTCRAFPDGYFDFILVDGRARASCMRHAVGKLKNNGVLMLDNSDRAQYQKEMARIGHLRRRDFCGHGPFADEPWQTTIWFNERARSR